MKNLLSVENAALAATVEVNSQIERWGEVEDSKSNVHYGFKIGDANLSFPQPTTWIIMTLEDSWAAQPAYSQLYDLIFHPLLSDDIIRLDMGIAVVIVESPAPIVEKTVSPSMRGLDYIRNTKPQYSVFVPFTNYYGAPSIYCSVH